jgi:hypothetical protein
MYILGYFRRDYIPWGRTRNRFFFRGVDCFSAPFPWMFAPKKLF